MFADDTNVYLNGDNVHELVSKLNVELKNLSDWFKAYKLSLNTNKTKFQIFTISKSKRNITFKDVKLYIDNVDIEEVKTFKFLGIMIDSKLRWDSHITYICNKISRNIRVIR